MKHNHLLYILKFANHNLIKVGISTDFRKRIEVLRQEYSDDFDLDNSFIITGRKETIRITEKQILDDLIQDVPAECPFDDEASGCSEIRLSRNLDLIINLIQVKAELNKDICIIKGIDLSGFHSDIIPRELYPHTKEAYILLDRLNDLVIELAQQTKTPFIIALNEIVYQHFVSQGTLDPKKLKHQPETRNYFKVPHERLLLD